jgi:dihydropteroate synthase
MSYSAIINVMLYHSRYKESSLDYTQCGKSTFHWGKRTYVMGIVNMSPDSFAGDGIKDNIESAILQAKRMASEGADIIDIGGESTRPKSMPIPLDEELRRVIPVLERLAAEITLPLSIDTYKLEVAQQALKSGANMINDIWGLKYNPGLAELAANKGIPIILMSNQRDVSPQHDIIFPDIISTILSNLEHSIAQAVSAGVPRENIIIDPGIGFGKTKEQNIEAMGRLNELRVLGRPILLASSRKSMINQILNLPPEQCMEGTMATTAIGIASGVDIVRVHDVKETVRVCRVCDAIIRR